MKVAIKVNTTRKNAYEVTLSVLDVLKNLGVSVVLTDDVKECFASVNTEFLSMDKAIEKCDILIAIGGDGTIIHSAHFAAKYDKPILGINAGRLGFLAGLEKEELYLLENLITGQYTIENRMMLQVGKYVGDTLSDEYICLNDVVVSRKESMRLCEIEAYCDKRKISDYVADGLIVSTPTGSTAYSLSAGGPIVDTSIESLILTPVCSHSILSRSMIFNAESVIELNIKEKENGAMIFSCDGEKAIELGADCKLKITKSKKYVKILKIKADSFSEILSHKLVERYSCQ